jgi:4-cresol dehydrogenase (hydroxylating)
MNKAARATFLRLIKLCGSRGWGEYRIHAAYMDEAISFYNYNSGALHRFHETLKDAVDPNGILSAGRYGIWPRHLRGTRV